MENHTKNKVVAIVGPTGSGKTALGVAVARRFDGVILSADSRQVYRGLDVGTNKEGLPGRWNGEPARIAEGIPQLLVDMVRPSERFTLADWLTAARTLLPKIWQAGQLPVVVGGTGLYVSALFEGYQPGSGRYAKDRLPVDFEHFILQTDVSRDELNQKSDERFLRIYDSLLAETRQLLAAGVTKNWLEQIGLDYRFAVYDITGQLSREEAIAQFQKASRSYIRRQLTWWRHHGQVMLVHDAETAIRAVGDFLNKTEKAVM